MVDYQKGDMICFKEPVYKQIGHELLIPAHTPVEIANINKNTVWVFLPNSNKKHNLRYIPERMYFATKAGRAIYG